MDREIRVQKLLADIIDSASSAKEYDILVTLRELEFLVHELKQEVEG